MFVCFVSRSVYCCLKSNVVLVSRVPTQPAYVLALLSEGQYFCFTLLVDTEWPMAVKKLLPPSALCPVSHQTTCLWLAITSTNTKRFWQFWPAHYRESEQPNDGFPISRITNATAMPGETGKRKNRICTEVLFCKSSDNRCRNGFSRCQTFRWVIFVLYWKLVF